MIDIKIKYDGKYPNLCSGRLVVIIDGIEWAFPDYCMEPGGDVWFDDEWNEHVEQGPWSISEWPDGFPEHMKAQVINEINSSVEWGNCGGCV